MTVLIECHAVHCVKNDKKGNCAMVDIRLNTTCECKQFEIEK